MAILEEFKKFAMRGNVVDMAVGVVIGAAFGPIVKSAVDDLLMPPIGLALGNVDFRDLFVVLQDGKVPLAEGATLAQAREAGAVVLAWGSTLNTLMNFLIVAFAVFLLVKTVNRLSAKEVPPPPPNTRDCPMCCTPMPIPAKRCPHCTSEVARSA
jgi:large conductance mechanosensitive channel